MSASIIAAGISAGSSLLGGLLNRSENRRRERRADPANVRKRFEAAGFNPLLGVGAMNAPVQYGPTMGDAVANAGSLAMSAYNQSHQLEIQRAELEMANQRLTELAEQARLRPTYPGPYQSRRASGPDADQSRGGARRANTSTLVSGSADSVGGGGPSGRPSGVPDLVAETVRPVDGRTSIGGRTYADPLFANQTERQEILPSEQYDIPGIRENPYMPAAGVITEQYGEPAEWFYAIPKFVGDVGYTAYREGQEFGRTYWPAQRQRQAARQAARERTASEIEDWWQAEDDWARQSALRQQITTPSHIQGRVLRDVGTTNGWNQGVDTLRPLNRF